MADNISMKQVPAGTVTATDDRILYDCLANGSCGVLYGCEIAYTGNNMIHINAGYGIIKGGLFEIEDHTEYVDYAESGVVKGQIYLHFDAAADDKLIIVKETTDQAHILEQDVNANYDSGVYEIQLCTFNATQTTLENVTQTFPVINGSVLDSLEEIMANTAPGLAAGALAVKSLNNNLGGVKFVLDENGKIIGYTTEKGGAGSVFPFSSGGIGFSLIEYAVISVGGKVPAGFNLSIKKNQDGTFEFFLKEKFDLSWAGIASDNAATDFTISEVRVNQISSNIYEFQYDVQFNWVYGGTCTTQYTATHTVDFENSTLSTEYTNVSTSKGTLTASMIYNHVYFIG